MDVLNSSHIASACPFIKADYIFGIVVVDGLQIAKQSGKQGKSQNAGKDHVTNVLKELFGREGEDALKQICELLVIGEKRAYYNSRNDCAHKTCKAPTDNGEHTALFAILLGHENGEIFGQRSDGEHDHAVEQAAHGPL